VAPWLVLVFCRKRRPLGLGAPPADLREGPARPARSVGEAIARPRAVDAFPRRLPPPRLSADAHRLHGEARHAGARWAGGGEAVRERREVAGGGEAVAVSRTRCSAA